MLIKTFKAKTLFIVASFLVALSLLLLFSPLPVEAALKHNVCGGANLELNPSACASPGDNPGSDLTTLIANIVQVISVIVGIVAVIMIIWGGFKFITSGGDSGSVASARNTIIYALIGLVIVALAQIIVRFVLTKTPN